MPRSSSAEPVKPSKRKGARSVSTLTPSQLARKRANDREAQRAIRARTKEHIDRLERELEEMRSNQNVQQLLRRNKALEDEIQRLRATLSLSLGSPPYSAPAVYDDNLSTISGAIPSSRMSSPSTTEYTTLPDYVHAPYITLPKSCDSWVSAVPGSAIPASVPSPSSSVNTDEHSSSAYIPTSVPTSLVHSGVAVIGSAKESRVKYESLSSGHAQNYVQQPQRPQDWASYSLFYDNSQSSTCASR